MNVEIRKAEGDMAADLTAIAFAAKRHWNYPEEWIELWADELTIDADYIEANRVLVAQDATRIVGWCAVAEIQGEYWLDYCWVLPEAAGLGIGRMLVQQAFELAAELDCDVLRVIADPNATGFYQKLGFVLIGEQPSRPEGRRLPVLEAPVPAGA